MKKGLISTEEISIEQMEHLFELADEIKQKKRINFLRNVVSVNIFFEPSTRTRLSFEGAIALAGGNYIEITEPSMSSKAKGESFEDMIRMVENYGHVIIIRHPEKGIAAKTLELAKIPVINAGDGINEHPTQALQDIYTLRESIGDINGIVLGVVGDLKYGRTVNSLIKAISKYTIFKIYFISSESLKISQELREYLISKNIVFIEVTSLEEVMARLDVLYVTRIQKERFANYEEYEKEKDRYCISMDLVKKYGNGHMKIMHPLPRNNELSTDLDSYENSIYFQEAENGVYIRQALIGYLTGKL